jgi:hypothetical protein
MTGLCTLLELRAWTRVADAHFGTNGAYAMTI